MWNKQPDDGGQKNGSSELKAASRIWRVLEEMLRYRYRYPAMPDPLVEQAWLRTRDGGGDDHFYQGDRLGSRRGPAVALTLKLL